MRYRRTSIVVASAIVAAACTAAGSTPATAPPTPETTTTATVTPSTAPTTTVDVSTTTTVDRLSEIQAIFEDLERRRLQALFSGDRDAFGGLFTDTPYRKKSLDAFDQAASGQPPDLKIRILEVLRDDAKCLVFVASTTSSLSTGPPLTDTTTLQPLNKGWGYAYVEAGRGDWLCEGPHPLSG